MLSAVVWAAAVGEVEIPLDGEEVVNVNGNGSMHRIERGLVSGRMLSSCHVVTVFQQAGMIFIRHRRSRGVVTCGAAALPQLLRAIATEMVG